MSEQKSHKQNLHPDVWKNLNFYQRIYTLQALENDHAKQGGRDPWRVKPVQLSNRYFSGKNVPKSRTIEINELHIQAPALVCVVVHTVLHEGRHAYQRAAIKNNSIHNDKDQVRLWAANAEIYIRSDKNHAAYMFQPVERDAAHYARTELIKIYSELEKQHGPIEDYRKTIKSIEMEFREISEEAKRLFGADYTVKIDRAIMDEYQKQLVSQQEKTDPSKDGPAKTSLQTNIYRIDVQFPDGRKYGKLFEVVRQPDLKNMRSAIDREAKGFVEQTVIRQQVPTDDIKHLKIGVSQASQERAEEYVKQMDSGIDKMLTK
jgi:hypothetical protein